MRRFTAAALAAGSIVAVAACNLSSTLSSASSTGPTTTDAAFVSQGVETSLESAISSMLGGIQPPTAGVGVVGAAKVMMPYLRLAHVPVDLARSTSTNHVHTVIHARQGIPSCVTVTPDPVTYSAGGTPDTVTMTAAANCTFTEDGLTLSISGSLTEGDPTPTLAEPDYTATVNNLVIGFSGNGDSATIGLNGTATVTGTTDTLTQSNNLTLTLMSSGTDTVNATYAQNWMITFAYTGSTPLGTQPLPAGTLNISGTTNYSANGESYALSISTPTPLTYDPTCSTSSQLTAGVVQATFSGTNGDNYVTLTWSGCGDPTVSYVSPES